MLQITADTTLISKWAMFFALLQLHPSCTNALHYISTQAVTMNILFRYKNRQ